MERRLFLLQRMLFISLLLTQFSSFGAEWILNNPYPISESLQKIYYTSFNEQPKTLDPAKSYSSNEYQFIALIYEPILQYDYLARPFQLVPLTATQMPEVHYYDETGQIIVDPQSSLVARSVYTIHIKPGILFQPHPALAKDKDNHFQYYPLAPGFLENNHISELSDFKFTGTRELIADDYIYEIKRLANPLVNSPIYGLMSDYIVGFREFSKTLPATANHFIDLRNFSITGVRKIDNYTFEITLKGQYPQFIFWLAMPFFSPVPWEVDRFYSEPGMDDKNLGFGWYPIGTGSFMVSKNNPNSHMILVKNPNFRKEYLTSTGSAEDHKNNYLKHAGETLPMIDKAVFTLEKESIPRWNKFLQGYYDLSGISADSFDQVIKITQSGEVDLSPKMREKGMRLDQITDPAIFYLGFNMLDNVVGGKSEQARKLRQAISIAVDYDENITIFLNGRGLAAQGPIPPGIFGYKAGAEGINPYVYLADGRGQKRRSIDDAKQLMNEAGYPEGRDPNTGKPLILHYDVAASGGPDDKEQLNWMRKQFAKLGISLDVRATLYNRFQEKMRNGNTQIFSWGWNADYPDPENFFFLLYGANAKVAHGGENASNYKNEEYDKLFNLMKNRSNDHERQALINKMVTLLRHDAPWVWGINSQSFTLSQQWISPIKINPILSNTLRYVSIDVPLRNKLRNAWNNPILWPIALLLILLGLSLLPFIVAYYKKQQCRVPRVPL